MKSTSGAQGNHCACQGEAESEDMVEREAKRLEVLKRRQEREMGQLVQFELMRKTLQARILPLPLIIL